MRKEDIEEEDKDIDFEDMEDGSDGDSHEDVSLNEEPIVDQSEVDLNDQKGVEDINETKEEKQKVLFPEISVLSQIKNKLRKRELYLKLKKEKKEVFIYF